jgi:hypothetical protein
LSFLKNVERLKRRFDYQIFDFQVRGVLSLSPISYKKTEGLVILTMLCSRDFYQYLLAIYSFTQFLMPERVVIVNDGSLKKWHIDILREKVPLITVLEGSDYTCTGVPTYSSWKRLLAIEELVKDYYVIQMDADILTFNGLSEVIEAFKMGKPFILGNKQQNEFMTGADTTKIAKARLVTDDIHVQQAAEQNMDVLETAGLKYYVRACAGFAGFPKGSFNKKLLIDISACMYSRIGQKWNEWGSEQVTCNIITANSPSAFVLPLEKYDSVARYVKELNIIHFIGPVRFKHYRYNKCAIRFLKEFEMS